MSQRLTKSNKPSIVHFLKERSKTQVSDELDHVLFQGIFLTQGSNPCLLHPLHWQVGSLPLTPPGKPVSEVRGVEINLELMGK